MRVFDYSKLKERTWDNEILAYVHEKVCGGAVQLLKG